MRFTSPSRRALGLLAVSTIGMSTAVLGVAGIASAAPGPVTLTPSSLTTDSGSASTVEVGAGICGITWTVEGGNGGASSMAEAGSKGGRLVVTTRVTAGERFTLVAGKSGTDAVDSATPGSAGTSAAPIPNASGRIGGTTNTPADLAGGGGGAASIVLGAEGVDLSAFGGNGGGNYTDDGDDFYVGGNGGFTDSPGYNTGYLETADAQTTRSSTGNGSITAEGVVCGAPSAVEELDVVGGEGQATITFYAGYDRDEDNAPLATVTGYEVQVDGGEWKPLAVTAGEYDELSGSVAVANGPNAHTVAVRATSAAGPGAVASVDGVYASTNTDAPTDVVVVPGTSSIRVTWKAPADATGVTGYEAFAVPEGAQSSGEGSSCTVDAATFTCLLGVEAGIKYYVGVGTLNEAGYGSDGSVNSAGLTAVIAGPAVPASVPTQDNGDVTGPAGPISSLTAGQKITLQGTGYAPNSTVTLVVYSSPVTLGTVVADQNGNFSVEVTVPANLGNGTHHLVATGVDAQGNVRNLVITVTVSGGVATLATTGFDAVPMAVGGGLFLLAGAGLVVGARRRSTNA